MASEDWPYMDSLRPPFYVCLRRKPAAVDGSVGPMTLNGRIDKEEWAHVPWSNAFADIEGPERKPKEHPLTRFKMMHDDENLYVGAELVENKIWGTITEKNSTMYHENDFEVFFNPDGSRHHYYELEVNCLNTIWELLLHRPYKDGHSIESPFNLVSTRSAVFVDGVTNSPESESVGWCVEMSWSLAELQQFDKLRLRSQEYTASSNSRPGTATPRPPTAAGGTPRPAVTATRTVAGDVWRVNFSRVQYKLATVVDADTQQMKYEKVPNKREDNIVWAPTGKVDIHRPERWGYVFFSSQDELPGGEMELASAMTGYLEEQIAIERVLDAVYYQQREFFAVHGGFASTMQLLYTIDGLVDKTSNSPDTEASFPLRDVLQRYELSFPELSSKSDVPVVELQGNRSHSHGGSNRKLSYAETESRPTTANASNRTGSRHYAPALDTEDEEYNYDEQLNSLKCTSVKKAEAPPPTSPRLLAIQKLETSGIFSNFTATVRSAAQEWHMTHDGQLWRTR